MRPALVASLAVTLTLALAPGAEAQGRGRGPALGGFGGRFAVRAAPRTFCAEGDCSAERRLARPIRRETHGGFYDTHGRYQH